MHELLTHRGVVHAWHCDHLGHMNNMWFAAKFDEAGWNMLSQIGFTNAYTRDQRCGLAMVEQVITFKRELVAGDTIEVRSRVIEVRERVIRMLQSLYEMESGELCATQAITAVHMDLEQRKATPIPDLQRRMATDLVCPEAAS